MNRCLLSQPRIWISVLLLMGATLEPAIAKYTVCTITINSDNEAKTFKKHLKPSEFEFVEIVPGLEDRNREYTSQEAKAEDGWFREACARFKAERRTCDVLVISGHFGGSFFGSSNKRLRLETLEEMGCNNTCPGIMNSPKEVFMFGCNTLAGKDGDQRTPEQYRAILRAEVNANGSRVFTDIQVDEIVAFRYGEFGHSNQERMSRAFSQIPYLYGFDSKAPIGTVAEGLLSKYLKSIPNYAKHLEKIELKQASQGMLNALGEVKRINGSNPLAQPSNRALAEAFKSKNFTQCSGAPSENTETFCSLFDENQSLARRLGMLKRLLTGREGAQYLAVAKQFFERNPPKLYDASAQNIFDQIKQSPVVLERFKTMLAALEKSPTLNLSLVDLGSSLQFLTQAEADQRIKKISLALIHEGTVEAKDLVCSSLRRWPEIHMSDIKKEVMRNANSLKAITCLTQVPAGLEDLDSPQMRELAKNLENSGNSDEDAKLRRYSAWLIGMAEETNFTSPLKSKPQLQNKSIREQLQLKLLQSIGKWNPESQADEGNWAGEMAAWALQRSVAAEASQGERTSKKVTDLILSHLNREPTETAKNDLYMAFSWMALEKEPVFYEALKTLTAEAETGHKLSRRIAAQALETREKIQNYVPGSIIGGPYSAPQGKPCKEMPSAPEDTQLSCVTSTGGEFERVKDSTTGEYGWRDRETQLIWWKPLQTRMTQYEAELLCPSTPSRRLPTKRDFELAQQHGILEPLPDLETRSYWSSSADSWLANTVEGFAIDKITSIPRIHAALTICVSR